MSLPNHKIEFISIIVIKILHNQFEKFPSDATGNRNAPFHTAFLAAFANKFGNQVPDIPSFISMSSWLQGLNTTLGQTFFESVAHILSDSEKKEFTSGRTGTLTITDEQQNNITKIITNLSNAITTPNLSTEDSMIFIPDRGDIRNALDFAADVFIQDDDEIVGIELKSVRPNSGEMRGEKEKILNGKAALYRKYPGKNIKFFIGFPFDPTSSCDNQTQCDKSQFMHSIINLNKFFSQEEVLLSSELWDYLSGESGTMEELLDIINTIANPQFEDIYNYLNDNQNRDSQQYRDYLNRWHLYSEIQILNNDNQIKNSIRNNKGLKRLYSSSIFKDGAYCTERKSRLLT